LHIGAQATIDWSSHESFDSGRTRLKKQNYKKEYPMRKPELAAAIADRTGLTREKASEVITAFTDQVSAAASRGEDVTLIGFGTFNIRTREARDGRNPQTGEAIRIPASKTVGFKAGKALKDEIR
jgi:DNA-binding protein HU-alpha